MRQGPPPKRHGTYPQLVDRGRVWSRWLDREDGTPGGPGAMRNSHTEVEPPVHVGKGVRDPPPISGHACLRWGCTSRGGPPANYPATSHGVAPGGRKGRVREASGGGGGQWGDYGFEVTPRPKTSRPQTKPDAHGEAGDVAHECSRVPCVPPSKDKHCPNASRPNHTVADVHRPTISLDPPPPQEDIS